MFAVFDNMQKMLYTESVQKHHKKGSHTHDSSNSFITAIIMNWKYAFQFLREEMEPIRMLSNAAGIICNGEPQEQEGFYKGWKPGIQGINNNSMSLLRDYGITSPKHRPRRHAVRAPK
jgi:hypothetical protein